jgi:PTS system N-acetylglucosamine-specific IIC component
VADQIAGDIRAGLHAQKASNAVPASSANAKLTLPEKPAGPPFDAPIAAKLLAALGGRQNIRDIQSASSRLRIAVVDAGAISESALHALGLRGFARPAPDRIHVVIGPAADAARAALAGLT